MITIEHIPNHLTEDEKKALDAIYKEQDEEAMRLTEEEIDALEKAEYRFIYTKEVFDGQE